MSHILDTITSLLTPCKPAYIVGGTVRDMALGRPVGDVDLAVTGPVGALADRLAGSIGGSAFCMDAARDVYRVVVKGGPPVQVDISPLKGSIEEDLAGRDFTVNAMAIPLHDMPISPTIPLSLRERGHRGEGFLDPFGGMTDIEVRTVRVVNAAAFTADPLRLIRAFRMAQTLGFNIEDGTLAHIRRDASLIKDTSAERVRDEIYLILEAAGAPECFTKMAEAGLLTEVFPEAGPMKGLPQGEPHAFDLLTHSLKAMGHAECVLDDLTRHFGIRAADISAYMRMRVDGALTAAGLVKLCAFLHDTGKPTCMKYEGERIRFTGHDEEGAGINREIAVRLKMSAQAADALSAVTAGHMRPLHLSQGGPTRRAVYRYVRDVGGHLPISLVVALADAFATRDAAEWLTTDVEGLVSSTAEYYYGEYGKAKAEPLVTGRDLIDTFGLAPGPVFKVILDDVEEKRAEGVVSDRDGAIEYLRENIGRFRQGPTPSCT